MARQDRILGIVVFVLAALALTTLREYPFEARVFPGLILAILIVAAVAMFARSFRANRQVAAPPLAINPATLAIAVGATCIYVFAVRSLGFYSASILFVPATAYALGLRDTKVMVLGTAGFLALVYLGFSFGLQMQLPREALPALFN